MLVVWVPVLVLVLLLALAILAYRLNINLPRHIYYKTCPPKTRRKLEYTD